MKSSNKSWFARIAAFGISSKLVTGYKISFIVGSFSAYFTASNIVMPLSGSFTGIFGSSIIAAVLCLWRFSFVSFSPILLVHHIPGLFGAYYWASKSFIIRLLVPLICMLLFVAHPVGREAFVYSFFWLIPIAFYFSKNKNLFKEALGSTLTAHAVGSVIWLYTVPMISEQWISLIPVVILERLIFATGMVVLHKIISHAHIFIRRSYVAQQTI